MNLESVIVSDFVYKKDSQSYIDKYKITHMVALQICFELEQMQYDITSPVTMGSP